MSISDINLVGRCVRSWGSKEQIAALERIRKALVESQKTPTKKSSIQFPLLQEVVKVVESSYIGKLSKGRERWIASRVYNIVVGNK